MMKKENRTNGIGVMVLAVVAGLLWSGMAAAGDPVLTCEAAKIKAATKRTACLNKERTNALKGKPSDSAKCETQFDAAIAKADAKAAKKGASCRFVDNGDGTISDLDTLNMWEKKTNDGSVHDVDNTYRWNIASGGTEPNGTAFTVFLAELNNCESADGITVSGGFAGYCDWVMPDIARLQTILLEPFPCSTFPCVDPVFDNGVDSFTAASFYWSSSSGFNFPVVAWFVSFSDGFVDFDFKGIPNFVRAVRGGR